MQAVKTQHATFKVGLSLAAGPPFTVVSKVYVGTRITLEPNASGGKLPSRAIKG